MLRITLSLVISLLLIGSAWTQEPAATDPIAGQAASVEMDSIPVGTTASVDSCQQMIAGKQAEIDTLVKERITLSLEVTKLEEEVDQLKRALWAQKQLLDSLMDAHEPIKFDILKEKEIYPGAITKQVKYRGVTYDVLVVDDPAVIRLYHSDSLGRIGSLEALKKRVEDAGQELIFASNAGMFSPGYAPQGLYIENGQEQQALDTKKKGYGNFYMQPNGVFLLRADGSAEVLTTDAYPAKDTTILFATQSGPMLVANKAINSHFNKPSTNFNIRNGVGVTCDGKVVFVISNEQCNLWSFASLYRDVLNCPNALYLDGAISKTYLPAIGRKKLGGAFGPMVGVAIEKAKK